VGAGTGGGHLGRYHVPGWLEIDLVVHCGGRLQLSRVGYQRWEGQEAAQVLEELYGALQLFTKPVQSSFNFKTSHRHGSRIKR